MSIATKDDILYCFRLLLDREPNPEELTGHLSLAGSPLELIVKKYLSSAEFKSRGLTHISENERPIISDYHGFKIASQTDDVLIGKAVRNGDYEPEIRSILLEYLRPGMTFLDIGANIGVFSLFASKIVGDSGNVISIEASPGNVRLLEISRRLNGFENIEIHAIAADEVAHILTYNPAFSNGRVSDLNEDIEFLIEAQIMPALPIDMLLNGRPVDVCKIDVEGFELRAFKGARNMLLEYKPVIVSEFSAPAIVGGWREYLQFLYSYGYTISAISPDGSTVECGKDPDAVKRVFDLHGTDHIDILAKPLGM